MINIVDLQSTINKNPLITLLIGVGGGSIIFTWFKSLPQQILALLEKFFTTSLQIHSGTGQIYAGFVQLLTEKTQNRNLRQYKLRLWYNSEQKKEISLD